MTSNICAVLSGVKKTKMTTWDDALWTVYSSIDTFLKTSYVNLTVLLFLIYASSVETKGNKWTVRQWDQVC